MGFEDLFRLFGGHHGRRGGHHGSSDYNYGYPRPCKDAGQNQGIPAPAVQQQPCSRCGKLVQDGFSFCPACGAKLAPEMCKSCGVKLPPGAAFCPGCGAKM